MIRAVTLSALVLLSCTPAHIPVSTLDPRIQHIAQEELDRAVAEWQPHAAVVIVLDPATGGILAEEGKNEGKRDVELASRQPYVTGSTLKAFTYAAALEAKTVDLHTMLDCATRQYPDGELHDASPHGMLSLADALATSSNVGASRVLDTMGLEPMLAALRRFHLTDPPAVLPPVTDAKAVRAGVLAAGELLEATPMQIAAGYAAIINGGTYMAPTLTRRATSGERVLDPASAAAMLTLLESTITSEVGTGKLAAIPGHHVAGKTGTGQMSDDRYYASFVGTVLDYQPRFVVLVGLVAPKEGGYTGASAAAPTFARIATRIISRGP